MSNQKNGPVRVHFDQPASVLGMMEWFAAQDIPVLPIHGIVDGRCTCGDSKCSSSGKHPISSLATHGVKDATTDIKAIRRWHRKHPDMNYAVATDGLAVIDCDSKEALMSFRSGYRPPPTFTVKTARGFHFYYHGEMPARIGVSAKLDIKSGPGSYVVGPGSRHASGAIYAVWEDEPIADLPQNIADMSERPEESSDEGGGGPIPVGMRNSTLTQFAGYMHARNVPKDALLEALKALNRSMSEKPLPDREVRQIARSVSRYPTKPIPEMLSFADIPDERLEWLWFPFLSFRTLALLDGNPGEGKSQFTTWLCARVSRGDLLPNGDPMEPVNCFLCNFEDLPGAVIKKRLEANGADLSRVFVQSRSFRLTPEMVQWLEGEIISKKARLVILDPIQAVITKGTDTNSNVDVRDFMDQLREVAERNDCSIICIRHFGKGSHDKAMMKGIGSTDFVGIARNQLGLGRRKDGKRGFLVVTLKANYNEAEGALFKMTTADARAGEQPSVSFDRFDTVDADEFFGAGNAKRGPEQDEREVAKQFLLDALADGPKAATALKSQAEARAISASTLDRARKELKVISFKKGKIWYWSLPPE
jgi:Bifunctional DNA primase/polymerase, N-terminal/AAA domain/Primase C terminal 1 (PriCT-1)